ncbi:MAG: ABC transporter substrate-binding protein, partial [Betaproteobacteria bacterium]|nr:ABC transporter substrate-binding protein [Betaproteobacteria bacterium]
EASEKLAKKPNAKGKELLAEAREYAFKPLVSNEKIADKEFLKLYATTKRDALKTKEITALEEYWGREALKNYARAEDLAKQAAALAK